MKEDFYIDEQEVGVATSKIVGFAGYLAMTLARYQEILTAVNSESIKDKKICDSIGQIINKAALYEAELLTLSEEFQKNIIAEELCEVNENNSYDFPEHPDLMGIELLNNNYVEGL